MDRRAIPATTSRVPAMRSSALSSSTSSIGAASIAGGSIPRPGSRASMGPRPLLASSTSTLARKRGAADAGLSDQDVATKLRIKNMSLEGEMHTLREAKRVADEENDALRLENMQLRAERKLLADGGEKERELGESNDARFAEEKTRLQKELSAAKTQFQDVDARLAGMTSDRNRVKGELERERRESATKHAELEGSLRELQAQVTDLNQWKRRSAGLSIELEEQRRRYLGLVEGRADKSETMPEPAREKKDLAEEVRRQRDQGVQRQRKIDEQASDLVDLRARLKEAEARDRTGKEVERELRETVRGLQERLARSQRDVESLTQTFPTSPDSSSSSMTDAHTLQARLASLAQSHESTVDELVATKAELAELQARHNKNTGAAQAVAKDLTSQLTEAQRELRWATERCAAAEKRERMARDEADMRRSGSSMPGGGAFGEDAARVEDLERIVQRYKDELEGMQRDTREVEERIAQGQGLVKQSLLEEAQNSVERLQADIDAMQREIAVATSSNLRLDAEVNDLMRRVASGEYNPVTERVIELGSNPAAKIQFVRQQALDELRAENDALLEELAQLDSGQALSGVALGAEGADGKAGKYIPRESWERLVREKEALEAGHAKRLQRLKEIFSTKSKEFLEAVYSLLGWRIKFDESGADIRLTSMYAPKGKMGLTLKFASHEGHFGTMQMTGAMARGLEEARHFWIVERQSVPGFLAQVTTECFEKTTVGRAAGYVGLE